MKHFLLKHFHALKTSDRHWLRKSVGATLVIGGVFGFLPVLGYWMLPLGLALLAIDFPLARRLNRRLIVWWERQRRRLSVSVCGRATAKQPARRPKIRD